MPQKGTGGGNSGITGNDGYTGTSGQGAGTSTGSGGGSGTTIDSSGKQNEAHKPKPDGGNGVTEENKSRNIFVVNYRQEIWLIFDNNSNTSANLERPSQVPGGHLLSYDIIEKGNGFTLIAAEMR